MKIPRIFLFAGIGAALMYFLDPENGDHRRTMLREQASSLVNSADNLIEQRGEFASRARSALMETKRLVDNQINVLEDNKPGIASRTETTAAPKRPRSTKTSTKTVGS